MTGPTPPLTITAAAAALRSGEVTSTELTSAAIAVADAYDRELGTFLDRYVDSSLAAAAAADELLRSGAAPGPLTGVPLGIKDIISTSEGPTTAQSLVFDRSSMAGDAPVVARLRAAGGIVLGKLTTMEFACGMPDADKPFPLPRNPWDPSTWPGGSSSGTGGAVASGMVLGGLGTDTAGSIRMPAAFCGISGLMPTFGRVPKSGCVPLGYSLDHIGPMARSAADCALLLQVLAGYDASDATCVDEPVGDYAGALTGDLRGVRIGVDQLSRFGGALEDPAVPGLFAAALDQLRAAGAELVDLELPYYLEQVTADMVTLTAEAAAYHAPDLEGRYGDYVRSLRAMLAMASFYSAADFVQAQRVRRVGQRALAEVYADVDLVVTPTAAYGALSHDRLDTLLASGEFAGIYTGYWDSVGNPVLSVPMGFTASGLPLGLQLAGRPFDEALVLRAGDAYQQRTDWHLRVPPLVGSRELSTV